MLNHIALVTFLVSFSVAQKIGLVVSLDHFWYFVKRTHFTGYYSLSEDNKIKVEDFTKWNLFGSNFETIKNAQTKISFTIKINGGEPYCLAGKNAIKSEDSVTLFTDLNSECVNDDRFKATMDDYSLHPENNVVHGSFTVTCTPQTKDIINGAGSEVELQKSSEGTVPLPEKIESGEIPDSLETRLIV